MSRIARALHAVVASVAAGVVLLAFLAVPAHATDHGIRDLPPGVTAVVTGSGGSYYGDSLRVSLTNDTDEEVTVVIPLGTRFLPGDSGVQTMIAAGGERIVVPPHQTVSQTIKAFCGELHDRGPTSGDTFTAAEPVSGDLLDTIERIHREQRYDQTGQHAVWSWTDNYDLTNDPDAQSLSEGGGGGVTPGEAAGAGLAVAVAGGAAAVSASRSGGGRGSSGGPRRELQSGVGALEVLVNGGARQVQLSDGIYVLPPDDLPDTADAMAFDTRVVDGVVVIDPDKVAVWPREPEGPPPGPEEPEPTEPTPETTEVPPEGPPPAEVPPDVKLPDDERTHIIEWGLQHGHTPEEIQRDLDDRNRQLGGSGSVPGDDVPVSVQLPDGPATVTRAERDEYDKTRRVLDDHRPTIDRERKEYRANQHRVGLWSGEEQNVAGRWLAGTWELVQEANRLHDPGRYLATQNGCRNERELQIRDYGRPNSKDYLFNYDEYERRLADWERGPEAARWREDCGKVWSDALKAIQEKTDPNAEGQLSWMNRPLKELRDIEKRQQQIIDNRRNYGTWEQKARDMEQRFRSRSPKGGG